MRDENQLHAANVELIALDDAELAHLEQLQEVEVLEEIIQLYQQAELQTQVVVVEVLDMEVLD